MCVFMYNLLNSSVTKKGEMSYARKDGESVGGYSKSLRNFLHSGSYFCTSNKCGAYFTIRFRFQAVVFVRL